jgi:DNA-binding NarL/FixJ family response regulator
MTVPAFCLSPRRLSTAQLTDRTMNRLTRREQDIALLVHAGLTNKAIADGLGISVPVVKYHLKNTFRKLRISNRTLLAIFVQQSRQARS